MKHSIPESGIINRNFETDTKPFIDKCLQVLDKRYRETREGKTFRIAGTTIPKRFSERELTEVTGINWPALKDGRRKNLPPREVVMLLADYLECSLTERNDLLAATHYTPVEVFLEGDSLETVMKHYRAVLLKYMHYPSFILNRNWNILELSPAAFKFFGIPQETLAYLPDYALNALWLLFDSNLPIRPMIEANGAEYWLHEAHQSILSFKFDNLRCTHEPWYIKTIGHLCQLPDFEELYNRIDPANYDYRDALNIAGRFKRADGMVARIKAMFVRMSGLEYPRIAFYVPDDRATEELFKAEGFLLPEWSQNYLEL